MSDDLAVGGPGATTVLTTALFEEAKAVGWFQGQLESCRRELAALDRVVGSGILAAADAPMSALLAEEAIDEADALLARVGEDCGILARGVAEAARGYEAAEFYAGRLGQEAAARLGYLVGWCAPVLLAILLPGAMTTGIAWLGAVSALPESERTRLLGNLHSWFRTQSPALSDPHVVDAVRLSVMSADDAGWGLVRAPEWLATLLGDEGLGVLGVDTSAGAIVGVAAGVGLLRETPVRVVAVTSSATTLNVNGVHDRLERIPPTPEQIRIDRYSSPGKVDRFEVYIAGTAEVALAEGSEPWDMTSNLTAMSGASAGSLRAVEEAMRLAGVDQHSSVTLTGYSQGGLIAAQLAASGNYSVDGLLTVGAPAGQVAVPRDIPYVAIEHTNDLVPALGGTFVSSDPVIVRRQLFDGPPPLGDKVLPAHELSHYLETGSLVDRSANSKLRDALAQFTHSSYGEVTSTLYRADRVGR